MVGIMPCTSSFSSLFIPCFFFRAAATGSSIAARCVLNWLVHRPTGSSVTWSRRSCGFSQVPLSLYRGFRSGPS